MTAGSLLERARRYAAHTALCFVLFSLVLVLRQNRSGWESDWIMIRGGLLRDLAAEMPIGRQALVGSLAVMPLASLTALPFLPFLEPADYGLAVLFGLASLLAAAAIPFRELLRRAGFGVFAPAAPALLAGCAGVLGATPWADILACLPMLVIAIHLETRSTPEHRALAGVFWALALFAHVVGLYAVLLRAVWHLVARLFKPSPETRAIRWIQWVTIAYGFGVYLFLNGMILGSAFYPFTAPAWWRVVGGETASAKSQLARVLARRFPDCRPVASGPWGYAIRPLLAAADGEHVMDFHPRKFPPGETGPLVLVIPSGANPFAPLNDVKPRRLAERDYASVPLVEQLDAWTFVRLDLQRPGILR